MNRLNVGGWKIENEFLPQPDPLHVHVRVANLHQKMREKDLKRGTNQLAPGRPGPQHVELLQGARADAVIDKIMVDAAAVAATMDAVVVVVVGVGEAEVEVEVEVEASID